VQSRIVGWQTDFESACVLQCARAFVHFALSGLSSFFCLAQTKQVRSHFFFCWVLPVILIFADSEVLLLAFNTQTNS
jgi:hypothetical protein